jgi:hypothetical protein
VTIKIQLPADRTTYGILSVTDPSGAMKFGPFHCLIAASLTAGSYKVARLLKNKVSNPVTVLNLGVIPSIVVSGPQTFLIHEGKPGAKGELRSSDGVRVSNSTQTQLVALNPVGWDVEVEA